MGCFGKDRARKERIACAFSYSVPRPAVDSRSGIATAPTAGGARAILQRARARNPPSPFPPTAIAGFS